MFQILVNTEWKKDGEIPTLFLFIMLKHISIYSPNVPGQQLATMLVASLAFAAHTLVGSN